MPRPKVISQSEFPYNISARSINREWFQIPMPEVWQIFSEELTRVHAVRALQIHSFVLMSNHFHLIASTPEANISECMHQFMQRSSKRLTTAGNRINQTFAGRHYKCILQQNQFFLNAYKYNYRNPVAAGLCQKVQEYPYSSLQILLNQSKAKFPLVRDETFLSDPEATLNWLNTPPDPEKLEAVRYGLKHQFFKSKKDLHIRNKILQDRETL